MRGILHEKVKIVFHYMVIKTKTRNQLAIYQATAEGGCAPHTRFFSVSPCLRGRFCFAHIVAACTSRCSPNACPAALRRPFTFARLGSHLRGRLSESPHPRLSP